MGAVAVSYAWFHKS